MKVLFRFDASEALRRKVAGLGVEVCPESDDAAYEGLLPELEVLWHVLKPVTAVCAPHLAWLTQETLERSLVAAMENVRRLKAGMELHNRVA